MVKNSTHRVVVIGCSRQLGKSYALTVMAIEQCLQVPNCIVKFVSSTKNEIKRNISPLVRQITEDCPHELRPSYKPNEYVYRFPNGSEIQLAGTDGGHAESIRGNKAHLCIVDEAGFCDDLKYIVKSILLPTTTRTGGKIVMASTPSRSPDHEFMDFFRNADAEGRLIKKTIYDNPHLSVEQIDEIIRNSGGIDSSDFKREYLVETQIDDNFAVVPEFTKELQDKVIKEIDSPPYYDCYVSMDIGGSDFTAVLFGYYDFANARIVIVDEYLATNKILTDEIALNIKTKEATNWTNKMGLIKTPLLRVADNNNIILLNDLQTKHGIAFVPTLKDNADAALNNMRMLLKAGRIIIHPRCKYLIAHLRGAIWNKSRTSFARSKEHGHYDALHSLIYLCRNVNFNKNPYPADYNLGNPQDVHHKNSEEIGGLSTDFEKGISQVFKLKPMRRGFGRY